LHLFDLQTLERFVLIHNDNFLKFFVTSKLSFSFNYRNGFVQRPRLWAFGGLRERSLSWNDKVNAGAKPPECTSASQ